MKERMKQRGMSKREWSREDMKIANETEHTRKIE